MAAYGDHLVLHLLNERGKRMKKILAVVFTLSLVLLGGCENTEGGSSKGASPRGEHHH